MPLSLNMDEIDNLKIRVVVQTASHWFSVLNDTKKE